VEKRSAGSPGAALLQTRRARAGVGDPTASRAVGKSAENMLADGLLLATRTKDVAPAAIGMSPGR
jgi:hypothetical protein